MNNEISSSPLTPSLWVVAADGDQAHFFQAARVTKALPMSGSGQHQYYEEKTELELTPLPDGILRAEKLDDYDLGFDKRGSTCHTGEPPQTVHEELKRRFMRTIAVKLNQDFAKKSFDRLVIVVPAHLLGEIRKHLDPDVMQHVVAELPKELVHCDAKELLDHVKSALVSVA